MMVTLYSTNCPKCFMLEKTLDKYKIKYDKVTDMTVMIKKNIMEAPTLEVNGDLYNFEKALLWAKTNRKGK